MRSILALVVLAAAGCVPVADEPGLGPTIRLWRDVAPVAEQTGGGGEAKPELIYATRFGDRDDPRWFRVVESNSELRHVSMPLEGGPLVLNVRDGLGVMLLHDAPAGEAITVSARVAGLGELEQDELPVLLVIEHALPFDPLAPLEGDAIVRLLDDRRNAQHVVSTRLVNEPQEVMSRLVLRPETRQLSVYLVPPLTAPDMALGVEHVRIVRRPMRDHVGGGGRVPHLTRLEDGPSGGAVRMRLDRDEREGLLALAPTRYEFLLPPCAGERRLQLSLGLRPRPRRFPGAVRFLIETDRALLDETLVAPAEASEPAWLDRSVRLPPSPDGAQRLVLATEAVGDDPPLAFFGHPTVRRVGADDRPNVVLVSLDTLRPDRLGCYGGDPAISTHLDALASEGLRFAAASSTSSYTLPSHGSMLTGQFPALHGAVDVTDAIDPDHSPLLGVLLADAGYVTSAFTGGGYVSADFGFAHGFDRYSHNDPVWAYDGLRGQMLLETLAKRGIPLSMELLRRYGSDRIAAWIGDQPAGSPFFLFVHTYVAHNFAPSQRWIERFDLRDGQGREEPFYHLDRKAYNKDEGVSRQSVYDEYMPYYDATIGMADELIGTLVAALREAGLYENTMIVVTSDHGEEFGEHGFFGHGESLYGANTDVPLIAKLPGTTAGAVIDEPVSLVDIAPWILRTVGLPPDPRMGAGPPLGPDREAPPGRSLLFIELDTIKNRVSAVREEDWKLHVQREQESEALEEEVLRLYALDSDPGEQRDVAAEHGNVVARLRGRLASFHELARQVRPESSTRDLSDVDPAMIAQLRALGYFGDDDG